MSGPLLRHAFAVALVSLLVVACSPVGRPASVTQLIGRVVYVEDEDLWISRPDGAERRRLTSDGAAGPYRSPKWSPDGRWIAAVRRPPPPDLARFVLIDPRDTSVRVLSRQEVTGFSWSSDARRIAVALGEHGGSIVEVLDVATGEWRGLAAGAAPAWSPVDDRIAFETRDGRIAVLGPAGDVTRIAAPEDVTAATRGKTGIRALYRPAWSRDGKRLGFVAVEQGDAPDAVQYTVVSEARPGGPLHAYPIGPTGHLHDFPQPVWSPRGDVFAATAVFHVPHVHLLWLGDPRAAELRMLYQDGARFHFLNVAWSPDGAVLLLALDQRGEWAFFAADRPGPPILVPSRGMWPDWCCAR